MGARFTSFICLAGMRTGSNFLEENLNRIPGLRCWGEAFNPHFIGHAGETRLAGIDLAGRERRPLDLLDAMQASTRGLPGFRFFHDHDPRILDHCLADPACAKIVLTRNPLESYVSLEIARQTGQWRLSDLRSAKSARVVFDAEGFAAHLAATERFLAHIRRCLQVSGQTAFPLAYEDVGDLDVLNGIAAWLKIEGRLATVSDRTKVQNPTALRDKVENYEEMVAAVSELDPFALASVPSFEHGRSPGMRGFVAAAAAPVLYMPLRGGPREAVADWLAALDDAPTVPMGTQKSLRKWLRRSPGHRTFSVLRHPVERLHEAFCRHILISGPECLASTREILSARYDIPMPQGEPDADYDRETHRTAFLRFAAFVKGNLAGQTSIRTDPSWASQTSLLKGIAQLVPPDLILREDKLGAELAALAAMVGREAPAYRPQPFPVPIPLSDIYDGEIEAAVRAAYPRDYMEFGFAALR